MKVFFLLIFITLGSSLAAETTPREVLKQVCEAHNLGDIYAKKELSFQFNAKLADKTVTRNWKWDIAANKHYLDGKLQTDLSAFVNDIYWLIFPLKVYHDKKGTTLQLKADVSSPLAKLKSTELTVTHVGNNGYTPNDVYKLYLNDKYKIIEWSFHKNGISAPTKITTWENYQTFEGITLSKTRKGQEGFMIWFDNIAIE